MYEDLDPQKYKQQAWWHSKPHVSYKIWKLVKVLFRDKLHKVKGEWDKNMTLQISRASQQKFSYLCGGNKQYSNPVPCTCCCSGWQLLELLCEHVEKYGRFSQADNFAWKKFIMEHLVQRKVLQFFHFHYISSQMRKS